MFAGSASPLVAVSVISYSYSSFFWHWFLLLLFFLLLGDCLGFLLVLGAD
jgi:hypothetical protein